MAKGIKLRNWSLDIRDYETDDLFHAAVELELARFEHIGERFGIALVAAPIKRQVGGDYVTVGWSFQTATVPAVRESEPEPVSSEAELEGLQNLVEAGVHTIEDDEEALALQDAVAPSDDPYAEG